MKPNPGHLPPEAMAKRVRVVFANGARGGWPDGWRAETARWTLTGAPFDIARYEVI